MSTSQTPATGSAKPSLVSRIETDLVNAAAKIKAGVEEAGGDAVKLAAFLQKNQNTIAGLAALAGSKASNAEATAYSVLNTAINAVKAQGDAASANGLSVSLDSVAVASIKALIADLEKI